MANQLTQADLNLITAMHAAHSKDEAVINHIETTLTACRGMMRAVSSLDEIPIVIGALDKLLHEVRENPDNLLNQIGKC